MHNPLPRPSFPEKSFTEKSFPEKSFPEQAFRKALSLLLVPLLPLLLVIALAPDALAHRVNVFAWVDGTELRVECSFGGKTKVKNGLVVVRDAKSGKTCATTRTSGDGTASVAITQAMLDAEDGLVVLLDAGEGHQNTWSVSREELAAAQAAGEPAKETGKESAMGFPGQFAHAPDSAIYAPGHNEGNQGRSMARNAGQNAGQIETQNEGLLLRMSEEELAKLVDERLEAKIAPLRHMLAESVGPSLADIVGGIGWILGIFGAWALTRSRARVYVCERERDGARA